MQYVAADINCTLICCIVFDLNFKYKYRARFSSRTEVEQLVSEYVYFYNFERISLKNGLTPVEFRGKAA